MQSYDVIVTGAGVAGSAAAYALAHDQRVLLLEQHRFLHTQGSSHGGSRIFRYAYPEPQYVALARAAQRGWRALERDLDERLLTTTGGLDIGRAGSAELEQIEAAGAAAPAVAAASTAHTSAPRRRVRPALAASLMVALVGAGAATWLIQRGSAPAASLLARAAEATFTTAVGEQRDHALADGSRLAINTGSLVEVLRLDAGMRELRLQRGEALFSVAHDPARPFRVAVGGHIVEAGGTEFDIRLHEGGAIDVVVTEGRVRLLSGDAVTGLLDRGEAMRIGADGSAQVTQLDAHALAARLAWRRGMIEFRGQPLAEALTEFSRYTPVKFVITDPAAARLPIGGSVLAGDVDMLLEALHTNFGLESSRGPDGSIRITGKR